MLGEQWVKFCVFWDAAVFTVFELGSGAIFISCLFNNSEEGFTWILLGVYKVVVGGGRVL